MVQETRQKTWALVAIAISVAGTLGSLYLSMGLGLKACPLCFYQRTFMMSVVAVLCVGIIAERSRADLLCLLGLPLALAGLCLAGFHEYLVLIDKLECPSGILGLGTAPEQSLAVFVALSGVLAAGSLRNVAAIVASVALGIALAVGCVFSAPPMPPTPTKPYEQPLEICRPPFRP